MKHKKILLFVFLGAVLFLGSFYGFSQYFSWFSQEGLVSYFRLGEKQEVLEENTHYRFDDINEINSWTLYQDTSTASASLSSSEFQIGSGSNKIEVLTSDGITSGRIQFLKAGHSLVSGRTYILSFYAKSSVAFDSNIAIKQDISPWANYGLSGSFTFPTSWEKYEYRFTSNTTDASSRINFLFGLAPTGTNIWIDDLILYEVETGNEIGNNHAEVYGTTYADDQSGNSYGAMQFDGVGDVLISERGIDINDELSLSMWFKNDISTFDIAVISYGYNSGGAYKNTLTNLGYSYDVLSDFTLSTLSQYDLVFVDFGDHNSANYVQDNLTALIFYVSGGGNLFMSGDDINQYSDTEEKIKILTGATNIENATSSVHTLNKTNFYNGFLTNFYDETPDDGNGDDQVYTCLTNCEALSSDSSVVISKKWNSSYVIAWGDGISTATYSADSSMAKLFDGYIKMLKKEKVFYSNNDYGLFVEDGVLTGYIENNNLVSSTINTNWNHIFLTYDKSLGSDNIKLYVNNVLVDSDDLQVSIDNSSDVLKIAESFHGSISDVRIYNYALSESEISAIYSERSQSSFEIGSLNKGLIAHYPLNGTAETKDITPYANHGVNNGAVLAEGVDGGSEGSYSFDGVDDSIELGKIKLLGEETFSFWFKSDINRHTMFLSFVSFSGSNTGISRVSDNLLFLRSGSNYRYFVNIAQYFDNNWHHVVVTVPGGNQGDILNSRAYVDGIEMSTTSTTSASIPQEYNNFFISGDWYGIYGGQMSDVRIYNRALSETEIQTLYEYERKNIERSSGSLNKGLVLDMPLKEETMGTEGTENLIDSIGLTTRCVKYGNGVLIDWISDFGDTYFFFNLKDSLILTEGDQYTLSFDCNGLPEDKIIKFAWANTASNQITLVNGRNSLTFLVPSDIRAFFDDTLRDNTIDYLYLYNFQLEAKDHSTPFVVGTRKDAVSDNSPYKNHGEVNGAVISEDGADFDGVDDYIAIGNITPSTSDITLSMWINPNDLSGHSANVGLASLSSTTQARIILTDDASPNTQVRWRHADGSYGTYTLTSVMISGNWYFITMVYDSVAETLNGYLDGIKFIDNTSVDLYSNFNTINIGTASAYDYMDGQISNVKLYNRALSDDEVKSLYDMGR